MVSSCPWLKTGLKKKSVTMDTDTTDTMDLNERVSTLPHGSQISRQFSHQNFSTTSINPSSTSTKAKSPTGLSLPAPAEDQQMKQHSSSTTTEKSAISSHNTALPDESFISCSSSSLVRHGPMTLLATHPSGWLDPSAMNPPKIGARFSRESSKVLMQWFTCNMVYPYPSNEEMKVLQRRTSLGKSQIRNWLANKRRRQKMGETSTASTSKANTGHSVTPFNIPIHAATPSDYEGRHKEMAHLDHWHESTSEIESATAVDIANILTAADQSRSKLDAQPTDDELCIALDVPSLSNYQAKSDNSLRLAHSHTSEASFINGAAHNTNICKRRRHTVQRKPKKSPVAIKQLQFQCTFCAETFKTKYDWQRHEKSLHVSLERWLCSPKGTRAVNPENGVLSCVFCGKPEPTDEHINRHNPNSCQERIFTRKDHLMQHLYLVHKSKLVKWVTEDWKAPEPIIRSNCGFCGIILDSWFDRVEHLADHFKMGKTMADWIGDWGLDDGVLNKLENSFLPYKQTNLYFSETGAKSKLSPCNAYELLNLELSCFVESYKSENDQVPDNSIMQLEACRIVFASQASLQSKENSQSTDTGASWLQELILNNYALAVQAQCLPLRMPADGRLRSLGAMTERPMFADCPVEGQLHQFVLAEAMATNADITDSQLQEEACAIMTRMHQAMGLPLTDFTFNWFMTLARSSTSWLAHFKQRVNISAVELAGLYLPSFTPGSANLPQTSIMSAPDTENTCTFIGTTVRNLESYDEFKCSVAGNPFAMGIGQSYDNTPEPVSPNTPSCYIPSDQELQYHARYLMYFDDGPWNQPNDGRQHGVASTAQNLQ